MLFVRKCPVYQRAMRLLLILPVLCKTKASHRIEPLNKRLRFDLVYYILSEEESIISRNSWR